MGLGARLIAEIKQNPGKTTTEIAQAIGVVESTVARKLTDQQLYGTIRRCKARRWFTKAQYESGLPKQFSARTREDTTEQSPSRGPDKNEAEQSIPREKSTSQFGVSAQARRPPGAQPKPELPYKHLDQIERLRRKLLDLTARNRMLNFKHTKARSISFVQTDPEAILGKLLEGSPVWPAWIDKPSQETLEKYYPEWVEKYSNRSLPNARDWAERVGIQTSPDISSFTNTGEGTKSGKPGARVQTLFYPEELEKRLSYVSRLAKTAIEDSGFNILYLAYGFLEWRDREDSESVLAPLILVPVAIQPGEYDRNTRRRQYSLVYTNEEVQTNISLREKLGREHSLVLPEMEEGEELANYLTRCEDLAAAEPGWRVIRRLTLGFFNFSKLLLWMDLDPNRWPEENRLDHHPIIDQIFEGGEGREDGLGFAPVVSVDRIATGAPETKLISPADSSQHSAIVDVAEDRNIVIEGPPGTGKSQTITNIIGVALRQGKTVLFMSEKMAALEVVWSRLEKAGLSEYCLELHSHASKKRQILEQLATRKEHRRPKWNSRSYHREINKFTESRKRLNTYVSSLTSDVPGFDLNVHEMLWRVASHRSLLEQQDCQLPSEIPAEGQIDGEHLALAIEAVNGIIGARRAFSEEFPVHKHPLFGLSEFSQDPGWQAVSDHLNQLQSLSGRLASAIQELPDSSELTLMAIRHASKVFEGLGSKNPVWGTVPGLESLIQDRSYIGEFKQACTDEERLRAAMDDAGKWWKLELLENAESVDELLEASRQAEVQVPGVSESQPAGIRRISEGAETLGHLLPDVRLIAQQVREWLNIDIKPNINDLAALEKLLQLAVEAQGVDLEERSPVLESISDPASLRKMGEQRDYLERMRARLELRFEWKRLPPVLGLETALEVLHDKSGWMSRFDPDVRGANQLFKSLYRGAAWRTFRKKRVNELQELTCFLQDKERFEEDRQNRRLLGELFKGVGTPTEKYVEIVEWYDNIRQWVTEYRDGDAQYKAILSRMPESTIMELRRIVDDGGQGKILQVLGHLEQIHEHAGNALSSAWLGTWNDAVGRSLDLYKALNRFGVQLFQHLGDPDNKFGSGLKALQKYREELVQPQRIVFRQRWFAEPDPAVVLSKSAISSLRDALKCAQRLNSCPNSDAVDWIHSLPPEALAPATDALAYCGSEYAELRDGLRDASRQIGLRKQAFSDAPGDLTPGEVEERCRAMLDAESQWPAWRDFVIAVSAEHSPARGWETLKDGIIDGRLADDVIIALVELSYYERAINNLIPQREALNLATREYLERQRTNFQNHDDSLMDLYRLEIAAEQHNRLVPAGKRGSRVAQLTELALIEHEVSKKARHLPVRRLLKRAGKAVQGLKPCFMMSPLSVAQYIEPGTISFDLLIMDEASQIRPEDALGAIARSKQVVVVGDPKQLPPTNFFQGIDEDAADNPDEETVGTDNESILDTLIPAFARRRSLNWHYRSRHESLIAFSNRQFYDERLIVFPGPGRQADGGNLGVDFHHLEDGRFKGQCNVVEAAAIVRQVLREIRRSQGKRSVGVVAVNAKQADLLAEEWDRMAREHREIVDPFRDRMEARGEPLFFKNLENVQGDERDVIIISLTYGRDANDNMHQRFGPINHENGWRRLNVLFTRAKQNMVVFSSMRSVDVKPNHGNQSVTALKQFLEYCENGGRIPDRGRATGGEPDSPFEEDVISLLTRNGYDVEPQVGVAGYRIDIGVGHPDNAGEYVLGIECDGAAYHSAPSARDRDKLRQGVLENLGWRIYRIWSVDWFKHRDREVQKLLRVVSQAIEDAPRAVQLEPAQVPATDFALAPQVPAPESKEVQEVLTLRPELEKEEEVADDPASDSIVYHEGVSDPGGPPAEQSVESPHASLERKLRELRMTMEEEIAGVSNEKSLLRDEMIMVLVQRKPTSRAEFAEMMPMSIRQQIDPEQAKRYLETVLSLCEEYA